MIGAPGQRVQIILLDTRFFRTDLQYQPWSPQPAPLGTAQPDDSEQATMLGADQWRWLDQQLAAPADLRIIVSSIQVLTDAHRFESWSLFPRERQRLLGLIKHHDIQNAVLLSGDRHQGGLYREKPQQGLYELTSSSLNLSFANPAKPWIEPDPSRIGNLYAGENFGTVEIDWAKGDVSLMLRDAATGEAVMRQDIPALIRRAR
jgi:alkaline phosphatase D